MPELKEMPSGLPSNAELNNGNMRGGTTEPRPIDPKRPGMLADIIGGAMGTVVTVYWTEPAK